MSFRVNSNQIGNEFLIGEFIFFKHQCFGSQRGLHSKAIVRRVPPRRILQRQGLLPAMAFHEDRSAT